jgi:hypothetical protein
VNWSKSIIADLANVKNASSTPSFTFAEVSMNFMPSSLARALPCSSVTALLSVQSDLLPIRILLTPSEACCSMVECHVRMSVTMMRKTQRINWKAFYIYDEERLTVKRLLVCNIIYQQNSHSSSIVCRRDGPKPFLTSSIPLFTAKRSITVNDGLVE